MCTDYFDLDMCTDYFDLEQGAVFCNTCKVQPGELLPQPVSQVLFSETQTWNKALVMVNNVNENW